MRTAVVVVAVVLLAATLLALDARQSSPQALFEKALALEEVQGKVTEAIAVYQKVVSESGDKALAAQAQLHIGLCYERLGLEKARDAYEKVIKNYPGQAAAVAVAQEKLDAILRATSLSKKGEGGPTIRQVPTPAGTAVSGAVSPDGKYLADIGENECDLRIVELPTGRQRFLTTRGECSWSPRWSSDSTKLVVSHKPGLCVISLDGSAPRVLADAGAVGGSLEPLDWSPDQKSVLALLWPRDQKSLGARLVAVADGSVRSLKDFGDISGAPAPPFDCRFSPDGLTVVYSRPAKSDDSRRDVFLISADGSRETTLIQHPADDAFLEWLPDGRGILFASNRAGTYDLWSIQIDKGQPQGAPTLVRRSIGPITPMRLTRGGAFYYQTPASFMDVYTASLDPETGTVAGPPKKEPLPYEGHNRWPDWSPDGRLLAYVSVRPTIVGPFAPGRNREWIVSIYSADTGKVREFPHDRVFLSPQWSPDGRHLYLLASNMSGRGVYRMDVESGEVAPFLGAGENQVVRYFQVSADGKWMVYGRRSGILRRDAITGDEKELDRSAVSLGNLVLSPDGSHLAYALQIDEKTKVLKVTQFPDGTPKEIQRLTETDGPTEIAWSRDGRFIYYSDCPPAGGNDWHLWRVPAEGGTPQDVGLGVRDFERLGVHPDGRRITFAAATINPERSQVWVMENFLPARK